MSRRPRAGERALLQRELRATKRERSRLEKRRLEVLAEVSRLQEMQRSFESALESPGVESKQDVIREYYGDDMLEVLERALRWIDGQRRVLGLLDAVRDWALFLAEVDSADPGFEHEMLLRHSGHGVRSIDATGDGV